MDILLVNSGLEKPSHPCVRSLAGVLPGSPGLPVESSASAEAEGLGSGGGEPPILDIPTLPDDHFFLSVVRRTLTLRSRRIFSRAILGIKKPARYYFLTLTSSPGSPDIKKSWPVFRRWLLRQRPQLSYFYVMTTEGHGVIHLIFRLGKKEKPIDVKILRRYWQRLHQANQVKILRVNNKRDLVRYIADQRHKKSLAAEFAWQDGIVSWNYSKGWLPKGFARHFGRFWYRARDVEVPVREMFLHDWLMMCYEDPAQMNSPPTVKRIRVHP